MEQISEMFNRFSEVVGLQSAGFLNVWTIYQFGFAVISALVAKWIAASIEPFVNEQLARIEGQRALLRVLLIVRNRLFWLILAIFLFLGHYFFRAITWPSNAYEIWILADLAIAWFVISILSRLIRNRFLSRIIGLFAWAVVALSITGLFDEAVELLDAAALNIGQARITALAAVQALLLLVTFIWLALFTSQLLANSISKNEDLSPSVKVLISKLSRIALLILAVVTSLGAVGIDFTALAVFSGALGIGIGLGLQRIVSNFISGIILLLDKSIKPGDVIEIETVSGSTYGWVQHLGARYTAVRTRDGTETLIPNESFIEMPVTNWTHSNKQSRKKIPIGVSYDTDVERAIELILEAAEETPRLLKVPSPVCLVKGFGDSSVDLELRFWLNDPEGGIANVSSKLYLAIWKRFQAEGIEIPFPQRDLNIRSSVPIEVKSPSSRKK